MVYRVHAAILAGSILLAPFASAKAKAETVNNIKVTGVGNQGGQLYATLAATLPGCGGNVIYNSSETQTGPYVMSILLTARTSGMPIARIDYTVRAGGSCWIDLVQL